MLGRLAKVAGVGDICFRSLSVPSELSQDKGDHEEQLHIDLLWGLSLIGSLESKNSMFFI